MTLSIFKANLDIKIHNVTLITTKKGFEEQQKFQTEEKHSFYWGLFEMCPDSIKVFFQSSYLNELSIASIKFANKFFSNVPLIIISYIFL
jgi:hypothetical protein